MFCHTVAFGALPLRHARMHECTNAQMLKCSNAQMLECPNAQLLNCSIAQMLKCQILICSNAQMPNAQMSKHQSAECQTVSHAHRFCMLVLLALVVCLWVIQSKATMPDDFGIRPFAFDLHKHGILANLHSCQSALHLPICIIANLHCICRSAFANLCCICQSAIL